MGNRIPKLPGHYTTSPLLDQITQRHSTIPHNNETCSYSADKISLPHLYSHKLRISVAPVDSSQSLEI